MIRAIQAKHGTLVLAGTHKAAAEIQGHSYRGITNDVDSGCKTLLNVLYTRRTPRPVNAKATATHLLDKYISTHSRITARTIGVCSVKLHEDVYGSIRLVMLCDSPLHINYPLCVNCSPCTLR
eukprot:Lankesteria_metandrocarpae@DN371_c0_g1_i1.p1